MKGSHNKVTEDMWGDYVIEGWNDSDIDIFAVWLHGAAVNILFAEQDTIDRVQDIVQNTIASARAGDIDAKEAISRVRFTNLFTKEELETMRERSKSTAHLIRKHLYKDA